MTVEARVVQARAPYALPRALAATVVVVIGALSAHTWAGGTVPTGPGLALVAAVVLIGAMVLDTRRVPLWALLPAVAAAQLGLHESFGLVAEHSHLGASPATSAPDMGWTWQMVVAHLFVTALTAVLWAAGRRVGSYAVSFHARPTIPVRVDLRRQPSAVTTPVRSLVHLLVSPRRGPPLAVRPT